MTESNAARLYESYPRLYRETPYFECADGWFSILDTYCKRIEAILNELDERNVYVIQVKEKFGTLRFSLNSSEDRIDAVVRELERMSGKICEFCGSAGTRRSLRGWTKTVCDACAVTS